MQRPSCSPRFGPATAADYSFFIVTAAADVRKGFTSRSAEIIRQLARISKRKCGLRLFVNSRRFAEAIEKREKNHAETCGDEGIYKEMNGEQGRGMVQQHALGERQDGLVEVEE